MSEDSYSEKRLINSPFYKDANELRFEISVLNRQLEVAREYIKYFRMVDDENDSLESIRDMANEANNKIECIGKESGINLTISEKDGKE
jgi:hypothetical protein